MEMKKLVLMTLIVAMATIVSSTSIDMSAVKNPNILNSQILLNTDISLGSCSGSFCWVGQSCREDGCECKPMLGIGNCVSGMDTSVNNRKMLNSDILVKGDTSLDECTPGPCGPGRGCGPKCKCDQEAKMYGFCGKA